MNNFKREIKRDCLTTLYVHVFTTRNHLLNIHWSIGSFLTLDFDNFTMKSVFLMLCFCSSADYYGDIDVKALKKLGF